MLKQQASSGARDARLADYPYTLNFYQNPPQDQITMREFETFALDRLKVLRSVETGKLRTKNEDDLLRFVEPVLAGNLELKRNTRLGAVGSQVLLDERRKDHFSHFILRLAYCKSEDLRNWFVRQETSLFKLRFTAENPDDRDAFIKDAKLDITSVSIDDILKEKLASDYSPALAKTVLPRLVADIKATYAQHSMWDGAQPIVFYKTPFYCVPELVARRSVLIIKGWAYVAQAERVILVVNAFKKALCESLEMTAKALPRLDEDDRLVPVLNSLSKQYMSKEYAPSGQKGVVTHDQIPQLESHFPPCMQSLAVAIKRDSHLKHTARLQYGLFLKGIGLTLEEALIFWRKSFNRMSDDEFNKKGYAYNIRYNYGMEGKRTNYTPYSCMKIISATPGPGESHGCPFRHYSQDNLVGMLQRLRVKDQDVQEIAKRSKEGHYQLACTRLFEVTRRGQAGADGAENVLPDSVLMENIEHPNQYFDLSLNGGSRNIKSESDIVNH